jgi:predicted NACHT family NTPase
MMKIPRAWDMLLACTALLVGAAEKRGHAAGLPLGTLKHAAPVRAVAFAPDGKSLAAGGFDQAFRLWSPAGGAWSGRVLRGHAGDVSALAFAPDGKRVASGGADHAVFLWEPATGKKALRIDAGGDVWTLAFSPDGKTLVAGTQAGAVALWDAVTGKPLRRLGVHQGWVYVVAFSPDGKLLASAGQDRTVRLWDVAAGKELHRFEGHAHNITGLAFAPDGQTLVSGGYDQCLRFWDLAARRERFRLDTTGHEVSALAFSPDGRLLATGAVEPEVCLWEVATGKEVRRLRGHTQQVYAVAFAPDGRTLATASHDNTVRLWDVKSEPGAARWTAGDLKALWVDVAGSDGPRAYRAVRRLAAAPAQAVPFLKDRLSPLLAAEARREERVARLVADLDHNTFKGRERATKTLGQLSEEAEPALRTALAGQPSLEARWRLERLLGRLTGPTTSPPRVVLTRALAALEDMDTAAARTLLADVAGGKAGAWAAREAGAAVQRLARRAAPVRQAARKEHPPRRTEARGPNANRLVREK